MKTFTVPARITRLIRMLFGSVFSVVMISCPLAPSDPARGGEEKASLELTFAAPRMIGGPGRAVASGSGFLYIRTFGESPAASHRLYGPYALAGNTFSTNEIPVGSYTDMLVVYAMDPNAQFESWISGTDETVLAALKTEAGANPVHGYFDGKASGALAGQTELLGSVNRIAVTLVPYCGANSTLSLSESSATWKAIHALSGTEAAPYRRFLKLDLSGIPSSWNTVDLAIASGDADLSLAAYDAAGKILDGLAFDETKTSFGLSLSSGQETAYLYAETAGIGEMEIVADNPEVIPVPIAKTITSFTIAGIAGAVDETAKTISITVPYSMGVTALAPVIVHTGASISPASGTARDFSSPVTYTVTASDGTSQAYVVTVTREAPSSNADLASLALSAGTISFSSTVYSYSVNVEYAVSQITLTPTAASPYATIVSSPALTVSLPPLSPTPITVTVTAQDGTTTRTYTVEVTRAGPPNITMYSKWDYWATSSITQTTSPQPVTFGEVYSGGSQTIKVTIGNNGVSPLNVSSIVITGSDHYSFTTSVPIPASLPETPVTTFDLVILYTYAGTMTGSPYTGTITVKSDDPTEGDFVLNLTGTLC